MELRPEDLVVTSTQRRLSHPDFKTTDLIKIAPAAYVRTTRLQGQAGPWVTRLRAAEARLLATDQLLRSQSRTTSGSHLLFTGESALIALGVEPWWNNPDVSVRTTSRSGSPLTFAAIQVGDSRVPPVHFRQVRHQNFQERTMSHSHLADTLLTIGMEWAAVWISDSGLMGFLMLPVLTVGNCSGRRWGIDN